MAPPLCIVLLAACGRVDFAGQGPDASVGHHEDGASDASVGHDEDGDGVADAFDNCPGLANADQVDSDGDGIGDACDPAPFMTGETSLRFSSFETADPAYGLGSEMRYVSDAVHVDASSNQQTLVSGLLFGNADFWYRLRIESRLSGSPHKLAIEIGQSSAQYYYVELYEDASGAVANVEHYDGGNYAAVTSFPLAGPIHTGEMVLHLQTRTAPRTFTFDASWAGEPYHVTADTTGFSSGVNYSLTLENFTADIESVMVISTRYSGAATSTPAAARP
jgi:hypothetical protein